MPLDPSKNPTLLNLQSIAIAGGEYGALYDKGVLSVIETIIKDGRFVRSPVWGIILLAKGQRDGAGFLISSDEQAELQSFLDTRRWTLDEAIEFARGADAAARNLDVYEAKS